MSYIVQNNKPLGVPLAWDVDLRTGLGNGLLTNGIEGIVALIFGIEYLFIFAVILATVS